MMMTFPETVWSQKHADALNVAATMAYVPLAAMPPHTTQAAPASATTTNSNGGSATER